VNYGFAYYLNDLNTAFNMIDMETSNDDQCQSSANPIAQNLQKASQLIQNEQTIN
jgi:hypothetical protein